MWSIASRRFAALSRVLKSSCVYCLTNIWHTRFHGILELKFKLRGDQTLDLHSVLETALGGHTTVWGSRTRGTRTRSFTRSRSWLAQATFGPNSSGAQVPKMRNWNLDSCYGSCWTLPEQAQLKVRTHTPRAANSLPSDTLFSGPFFLFHFVLFITYNAATVFKFKKTQHYNVSHEYALCAWQPQLPIPHRESELQTIYLV